MADIMPLTQDAHRLVEHFATRASHETNRIVNAAGRKYLSGHHYNHEYAAEFARQMQRHCRFVSKAARDAMTLSRPTLLEWYSLSDAEYADHRQRATMLQEVSRTLHRMMAGAMFHMSEDDVLQTNAGG